MTLQIFERFEPPGQDPFYRVGGSFVPYCTVAKDKRFTDAELAAEFWKLMAGLYDGHGKKARARREVIERFATLPHFDEMEE